MIFLVPRASIYPYLTQNIKGSSGIVFLRILVKMIKAQPSLGGPRSPFIGGINGFGGLGYSLKHQNLLSGWHLIIGPPGQYCDGGLPPAQYCDGGLPPAQYCDGGLPPAQYCDGGLPPAQYCDGGLFAIISTTKTRIKTLRIMSTNYV